MTAFQFYGLRKKSAFVFMDYFLEGKAPFSRDYPVFVYALDYNKLL
jgi:hypothetical protein